MRIIYDTLGGDNAPVEIIKGAYLAKQKLGISPILCGKLDEIKVTINELGYNIDDFELLEANSKIENDEEPVLALRRKKDSSIVVAMTYLSLDKADAFISAGSTGALLAAGIFIAKRIEGLDRPPIATLIPTMTKPFLLIDTGANVDCSPEILNRFASMGTIYMKNALNIENPSVGLLNIGSEEGKGNSLYKETFDLLKENTSINFVGNVEARELPYGGHDIIVSDGFNGNIFLKTYEGTASMLKDSIIKAMDSEENPEILKTMKMMLVKTFSTLDYTNLGGAPLLGLNKPVFKAHGISNDKAIFSATKQAILFVENNVIEKIKNN